MGKVNLVEKLGEFQDLWSPKIVAELNGQYVKLVKGELHWNDAARRERLLKAIRAVESEPSLLGVSAHLLAVARKTP